MVLFNLLNWDKSASCLIAVNKKLVEMLGYKQGQLEGKNVQVSNA